MRTGKAARKPRPNREGKDIFDLIAGHMNRIEAAQGAKAAHSIAVPLDDGMRELLARRTAEANRAFGVSITAEQCARSALLRGLRMRRL